MTKNGNLAKIITNSFNIFNVWFVNTEARSLLCGYSSAVVLKLLIQVDCILSIYPAQNRMRFKDVTVEWTVFSSVWVSLPYSPYFDAMINRGSTYLFPFEKLTWSLVRYIFVVCYWVTIRESSLFEKLNSPAHFFVMRRVMLTCKNHTLRNKSSFKHSD